MNNKKKVLDRKLKIAIFAGDNIFSYLMARKILFFGAVDHIFLSKKTSGSIRSILKVFNKTSFNYFVYRSFIQILSRVFKKFSIEKYAKNSDIETSFLFNKNDFYKIKSQFDLSLAFNFDIIVPQEYLDNNSIGMINIHASKLPKDKGISPVVWSYCRGENIIFISYYFMDGSIDSGPLIRCDKIEIESSWSLFRTYCEVLNKSANIILKIVNEIKNNDNCVMHKEDYDTTDETYNSWPNKMLHKLMKENRRTYFNLSDIKFLYKELLIK